MALESVEEEIDGGDEFNYYVEDENDTPKVTLHAINGGTNYEAYHEV